jgi:hypothetical protein
MNIPSDALGRHASRGYEPPSRRLLRPTVLKQDLQQQQQQRHNGLSHYWYSTSDIFLGHPYDPPQYEASSLGFFCATRPTFLCRPIKSSDTTAAGKASRRLSISLHPVFGGVGMGSSTSSTFSFFFNLSLRLCDLPPSGVFAEGRDVIANCPTLAERPSQLDLDITSVYILFSSLLVTTPIDDIAIACSSLRPLFVSLDSLILSDYNTTHPFTT